MYAPEVVEKVFGVNIREDRKRRHGADARKTADQNGMYLVDVLTFIDSHRTIHDTYIRMCMFCQVVGSVSPTLSIADLWDLCLSDWIDVSHPSRMSRWISLQRGTYVMGRGGAFAVSIRRLHQPTI
jgi:hypothetical protein